MINTILCKDCKVKPACWFAHTPEDCGPGIFWTDESDGTVYGNPIGCEHEPQCNECMQEHVRLLALLYVSKN